MSYSILRKLLVISALLAGSVLSPAMAQIVVGKGSSQVAPVVNQSGVMPARIYVNLESFPKKNPGTSTERFFQTCAGTYADCFAANFNNVPNRYPGGVNQGAFREGCSSSHFSFDDPIVYPGERGRTHAHQFSGNNSTDAATDVANLENIGTSTCAGGILNRSAYWWPALVYHCPLGSTDGCTRSRDGEVIPSSGGNFYYKCSYGFSCQNGGFPTLSKTGTGNGTLTGLFVDQSVTRLEDYTVTALSPTAFSVSGTVSGAKADATVGAAYDNTIVKFTINAGTTPFVAGDRFNFNSGNRIQWFPIGFNVIAGNPNATAPQDARISWRCNAADGTNLYVDRVIPTAAQVAAFAQPCVDLEPSVAFPICWDGVNARSPGLSQSHVDTAAGYLSNFYTGCQGNPAFPVVVPELGLNIHTPVNNADIQYIRLSSDWPKSSGIAAGVTMHSDYIHGWSSRAIPEFGGLTVKEAIMRECHMATNGGPPFQNSDCHNHLLGSPARDNKWYTLN